MQEGFRDPVGTEIADILGQWSGGGPTARSPRPRSRSGDVRARFDTDESEQHRVTERFLEATSTGNLEALMAVPARSNARGRRRWTCARYTVTVRGAEKAPASCSPSRPRSGWPDS